MTPIHCRILAHPTGHHAQQVFTGFEMLKRRGIVRLTQEIRRKDQPGVHTRVIVNNDLLLHYDLADYWSINEFYLERADFYFKRSYAPGRLATYGSRSAKIQPLGLNYLVYPDSASRFALQRALAR